MSSVSDQGVALSWVGRKGTVTTLSHQSARLMLVRAGRLEVRKHGVPRIGGVELVYVGRRVRVYWPGDDCMYGGEVVAYELQLYDDATRARTRSYVRTVR